MDNPIEITEEQRERTNKILDENFPKEQIDNHSNTSPERKKRKKEITVNKTVTLSKEEIATLNKIRDYLTEDEITRFFPKFKDILAKVNNG